MNDKSDRDYRYKSTLFMIGTAGLFISASKGAKFPEPKKKSCSHNPRYFPFDQCIRRFSIRRLMDHTNSSQKSK